MPSVGLVWDMVSPLQLLPAPKWLQLLLSTQVPLSSCQAMATVLYSLHLRGYHGHVELCVVLLTHGCQDCLGGEMIQRMRSCGCWP